MIEIEPTKENGEQEIRKQDKLITTKFQIEIENRKVEGLITYSTDQQIFKFKVNSWGVNIEFTLYELKYTIDAILQHMGFYLTTENPCVMMRVNHKTKSCKCIIIHQDQLYIASSTLQESLHIMKEKYKIKIIPNNYQGSDFPYDPGGTLICYRQYMQIHKKYTYQHFISHSSIPALHTFQHLYIQETSYMKWKANTAKWGVSMKTNNENENFTLHFIFHTNIYILNHQGSM